VKKRGKHEAKSVNKFTLGDKVIQECNHSGVPTEHVISASSHPPNGHAHSVPDPESLLEFGGEIRVGLKHVHV